MPPAALVQKQSAPVITVTVNEQVFVFPELSVAVQFTVVVPSGNTDPEAGELLVETIPQLSVTIGAA